MKFIISLIGIVVSLNCFALGEGLGGKGKKISHRGVVSVKEKGQAYMKCKAFCASYQETVATCSTAVNGGTYGTAPTTTSGAEASGASPQLQYTVTCQQ